ncbi:hypothetical protein [Streptomyces collinus]|uniref:hypothetical protein n=1 Tax=Streptomyces collinus TaxID=42684 RepID=UPI0037D23C64
MPAPTPDAIRTAADTLSDLTDYLRDAPDAAEALALVEPLLDEYTGVPVQLADTLRALARAVQDHPTALGSPETDLLIAALRTAAWEQADQHVLHYVLDNLRSRFGSAPSTTSGHVPCR